MDGQINFFAKIEQISLKGLSEKSVIYSIYRVSIVNREEKFRSIDPKTHNSLEAKKGSRNILKKKLIYSQHRSYY